MAIYSKSYYALNVKPTYKKSPCYDFLSKALYRKQSMYVKQNIYNIFSICLSCLRGLASELEKLQDMMSAGSVFSEKPTDILL